jgi:hypothetical protein
LENRVLIIDSVTRQENVRQENKSSLFSCLTFSCLVTAMKRRFDGDSS